MSLVTRALRARAALTLGASCMAALATAAAVLGPGYAEGAALSLLSARLDAAPSSQLGLSWRVVPSKDETDPASVVAAARRAARRGDGAAFAPAIASLTSRLIPAAGGPSEFTTLLAWRQDQCEHLRVEGRCPSRPGEALMSHSDARFYAVRVGSAVRLATEAGGSVRIVGLYGQLRSSSDYWYDTRLIRIIPTGQSRLPPHSAPLLVDPAQFAALTSTEWSARVDRPLDVTGVTLDDVRASSRVIRERARVDRDLDLGVASVDFVQGDTQLAVIARQISSERHLLIGLCVIATLPLVALAILLLYLLVGAAADQRRPELALAKLRGLRRGGLVRFGLAEPVTVAMLGCAAGGVVGWLAVKLLAASWLRTGTPTPFTVEMAFAAVAVFATGVLACAGAVTTVVREHLRTQLAGMSRPLTARRGVVVVQAMVIALAIAASYQVVQDRRHPAGGRLGLVAPLFLALAMAVLGSYAMTWLARRWLTMTRGGRGSAGFLASRRLARRRDGVSLTAPVVAAVTLAVFAGSTWQVGDQWRLSQARMQVGADVAYTSALDPWRTQAVVDRADPQGRWLMTTLQELGTDSQSFDNSYRRLFVDATRFARVTSWDPSWSSSAAGPAAVQRRLLRGSRPPLEITGSAVAIDVSNRLRAGSTPYLDLQVRDSAGIAHDVVLGPLPPGRSTTRAALRHCGGPCRVEALAVSDTGGLPISTSGTLTFHRMSVDDEGVNAGFADLARWRAGRPDSGTNATAVKGLSAGAAGLRLTVDTRDNAAVAAVVPTQEPAVPSLVVAGSTRTADRGASAEVPGADGVAVPVSVGQRVAALPVLGTNGVLGDLSAFLWEANGTTFDAQVRVLARADTPARVLAALSGSGIDTTRPDRLASRVRALDADPYAMGLRLYLAVAIVSLLLAFAGVAAMLAVQTRWRSVEAAALRVVGLSPRSVVTSALAEFAGSMCVAVLLGLVAGILALTLALPALALGTSVDFAPPADYSPRWGTIGLVAAVAVVGSVLAAYVLARAVVSRGRPQLLRETEG